MFSAALSAGLRTAARACLVLPTLLGACQCATDLGSEDAGPTDGGIPVITCEASGDCPQDVPECSFGLCKRPCAASDGCVNLSTFCNAGTGYCEPGCRDSSSCTADTVCSSGACISGAGCATKCDCGVGEVCLDGACQAPPATCAGPQDCPRGPTAPTDRCDAYACNGFTHQCFDPDPQPCAGDGDCVGRPGCAEGCTCTGAGQCVPDAACTVANESTTCGAGFYCDDNGACQVLPPCVGEAQCTALDLTCNIGHQTCERAHPCATSADCTIPPTTFCNLTTHFCAPPNCQNGGVTCDAATQTCSAAGGCVPLGTGGSCTNDNTCAATEYCAISGGVGACAVGCRNNASCAQGQQCNAAHTCVGGGAAGGEGAPCLSDFFGIQIPDDSLCQAGLTCDTFNGTCFEACAGYLRTDCAGQGCCALTGHPCCNLNFACSDGLGGVCFPFD